MEVLRIVVEQDKIVGVAQVVLEPELQQTTIKLDVLKMLLRLAEDVGSIPTIAYLKLTEQLTEIGRMLGGWIRSIK